MNIGRRYISLKARLNHGNGLLQVQFPILIIKDGYVANQFQGEIGVLTVWMECQMPWPAAWLNGCKGYSGRGQCFFLGNIYFILIYFVDAQIRHKKIPLI